MNAIVKKSLNFILWVNDDRQMPKIQQKHLVRPQQGVQSLPDWVSQTATFKSAVSDGSLIEVNVKEPPAPKGKPGRPRKQDDSGKQSDAGAGSDQESGGKSDDAGK